MSTTYPASYTYSGSNPYMDGLIWGGRWADPDSIQTTIDFVFMSGTDPYGPFTGDTWLPSEKAAFRAAAATWEAVANIDFVELSYAERDQADIWEWLGSTSSVDAAGWHYVPEAGVTGILNGAYATDSDSWSDGALAPGGVSFSLLVHEIGHGLGLAHPHDRGGDSSRFPGVTASGDTGSFQQNQGIYTVMSYNDGWVSQYPDHGSYLFGYASGPMAFDIAAIQLLYGANTTTASGNDLYALPSLNGAGTYFTCIWDTGGADEISAAGIDANVTIDLREAPLSGAYAGGHISWVHGIVGGFTIANGVTIENATGGNGDDNLTGNDANNRLEGGAGDDILFGRGGQDTFVFGWGSGRDIVGDYDVDEDVLVFLDASRAVIDASTLVTGHDNGDLFYEMSDGSRLILSGYSGVDVTITGERTGAIQEGALSALSGDLDVNDPLNSGVIFAAIAGGALDGDYGVFSFDNTTGAWSYRLDDSPSVDALAAGQVVSDSLEISDALRRLTISLDITITGVNDAPTRVVEQPDVTMEVGQTLIIADLSDGFADVDTDTTLSLSATANGGNLPSFMTLAADRLTITAPDAAGHHTLTLTASDGMAAVSDHFVLSIFDGAITTLPGSPGVDVLSAAFGNTVATGGAEADRIVVFGGTNALSGDDGNDVLAGGRASDHLLGGAGDDVLIGDLGAVYFYGADVLNGGAGNDLIMGGGGADLFVFAPNDGVDIIARFDLNTTTPLSSLITGADFNVNDDRLDLTGFGFLDAAAALEKFSSDSNQHAVFNHSGTIFTLYGVDLDDLSATNFLI